MRDKTHYLNEREKSYGNLNERGHIIISMRESHTVISMSEDIFSMREKSQGDLNGKEDI